MAERAETRSSEVAAGDEGSVADFLEIVKNLEKSGKKLLSDGAVDDGGTLQVTTRTVAPLTSDSFLLALARVKEQEADAKRAAVEKVNRPKHKAAKRRRYQNECVRKTLAEIRKLAIAERDYAKTRLARVARNATTRSARQNQARETVRAREAGRADEARECVPVPNAQRAEGDDMSDGGDE